MPSFKLDGKEIPFEPGESIIKAAWRQGIEIPHYCWHPGLSVAANCRMCLVEVKAERPVAMPVLKWSSEKNEFVPGTKPKLTPACQSPAVDGQEVFSKSPEAREALILIGAGGFSYEEAAKLCNCAVGTLKARVSRARKLLSEQMR